MTGTVQVLSYGSDLSLTVSGLLSTGECQSLIQHSEARGYEPAPITTPRGFLMRPDVRSNTRVMYDDPALAARIWERLRPHVPRIGTWCCPWTHRSARRHVRWLNYHRRAWQGRKLYVHASVGPRCGQSVPETANAPEQGDVDVVARR